MKKISLLLAMLLVFTLFAGCNSNVVEYSSYYDDGYAEQQGGTESVENSGAEGDSTASGSDKNNNTASGVSNSGKDGNDSSSKKTIEISYWNTGLRTKWLENVIKGFEKAHPEYKVKYNASSALATVEATFGTSDDSVDLYLAMKRYDTSKLEPLDDLLNSKASGESKTISQKFNSSYLALEKASDGHYYNLTYGGGISGIVYNTEHFKKAGIKQEPRTTNELALACDSLYNAKYTPLCHFSPTGYWAQMTEAFFCQYDGYDYFVNNFYGCKDESGKSPSKSVFTKQDGRYQALKFFEKVITPQYVLAGSNSMDHITMQTKFIAGKCSMMVNGSWVANEMASVGNMSSFKMMKTPVLSAITDKLSTVKTEGVLRSLITAIDNVTAGTKKASDYAVSGGYNIDGTTVSQADWDYVNKARHTVPSNYSGESAYIPKTSDCKDGAKEFLRYLYSDAGYDIFTNTLHLVLPITKSSGTVNTSGWNTFQKSQYTMLSQALQTTTEYIAGKHRIFYDGGAKIFADYNYISELSATNASDRKTANQIWDIYVKTVNDKYDTSWLANIK